MNPERWRDIQGLFAKCLELPADQRQAVLDEQCGGDVDLREAVLHLLSQDARGDTGVVAAIKRVADDMVAEHRGSYIGVQIGVWRLVHLVAQGGMGAVYLAERTDGQFEQRVAIKLLNPATLSPAAMTRFDITRYLEDRPVLARPDTVGYRARKFLRRNRMAAAVAGWRELGQLGDRSSTLHPPIAFLISTDTTECTQYGALKSF
jgi:hypothetical protein